MGRACTGHIAGAFEDFEVFVTWAKGNSLSEALIATREAFIADLKVGKAPAGIFTPEVLTRLKNE